MFTTAATSVAAGARGRPTPPALASALSAGQAPKIARRRADPRSARVSCPTLGSAYADGLREVFLACGIAGLLGGLLVLLLVRAAPPDAAHAARPQRRRRPTGAH